MTGILVRLVEWQRLAPDPDSALRGLDLAEGRAVAEELTATGRLEVLDLARGVELRSTSWVGRVELGPLTVTIQPKLAGAPFLHLLRYAYGLRRLSLKGAAGYTAQQWTFQDLLARQLASEVDELIARGLHRDYRREPAVLAVPRGRIDFQRYVMAAGGGQASLPCIYHPRARETVLNQVLRAGVALAARATGDFVLRGHLRRLGATLDLDGPRPRLDRDLLALAWRSVDRRTRSYEPALTLIGLMMEGMGISLDQGESPLRLPGFLFDMNRFFQALLSRFIGEHLAEFSVLDEHRLGGMFEFAPDGNPKRRRAPVPRPDFVVLLRDRIVSVLDAKYRDLWVHSLPRDMLYQLAMYALGAGAAERQSTILYPTLHGDAVDQTIVLRDPLRGGEQARIVLRPVDLLLLESLISEPTGVRRERRCASMARQLVFGGLA